MDQNIVRCRSLSECLGSNSPLSLALFTANAYHYVLIAFNAPFPPAGACRFGAGREGGVRLSPGHAHFLGTIGRLGKLILMLKYLIK